MNKSGIQQILAEHPNLQEKLFARGFLFTNLQVDEDGYPFFGRWRTESIGTCRLYVSPTQQYHMVATERVTIALVGHAYNPFAMECREDAILSDLANLFSTEAMENPSSGYWKLLNELTGIFTLLVVAGDLLYVIGDATGMQTTFYTLHGGDLLVSSHTNLIGDLIDLHWDPYVERLTGYRFFPLLGNSLPGDLTQFSEVKRLVPNHYVCIDGNHVKSNRFFLPQSLPLKCNDIVNSVAQIMQANMALIAQKWERPAISLTGGCDSKTTLAGAAGNYDRFGYFSYISSEEERVDAEAAHRICEALGLEHTVYEIPTEDSMLPAVDAAAELLNWNTGDIRRSNPNDVRKRVFFSDVQDFDVEVKSWASEIGRAYFSKRFNGRTDFGEHPTPRACTTLYKFFLHDRRLVRQTDEVFERYLETFFQQPTDAPLPWQEQFFWEFRVPSWNGLVITGEHRYSFDITVPYNNRCLLELLLSAPIENRISDAVYTGVRRKLNPAIDETGVSVTNVKHTNRRAAVENVYYVMHSMVPL